MSFKYQTVKVRVAGFVEAKVDEHNLDARLNDLGQQWWDLVTKSKFMMIVTRLSFNWS